MWQNTDPREAITDEGTALIVYTGDGYVTWAFVGPRTIQIEENEFYKASDRWPEGYYWSFPPDQLRHK